MTNHAPKGLGAAGKRLWRDVTGKYELRPDELRVLESACRTVDMIGQLEDALVDEPATVLGSKGQVIAHPLIAEVRMQRMAFAQLLRSLKLPDEGSSGAAVNQQRSAARERWMREAFK